MDGQTGGRTDGQTDGQIDGKTHVLKCKDASENRCVETCHQKDSSPLTAANFQKHKGQDGRTDGWTDGRVDKWTAT